MPGGQTGTNADSPANKRFTNAVGCSKTHLTAVALQLFKNKNACCIMELLLTRTYAPEGTNGNIFYHGIHLVYTIELPWKDNHAEVSCIPEGSYALVKRYSPKFDWHLMVMNVPGRDLILIHPA